MSSPYACTKEDKDFKYTYLETTDNSSFELKARLFVFPWEFRRITKRVCFVAAFVNKQNTLRVKYNLKERPQETWILYNSSNAWSWSGKFALYRSASHLRINQSFCNHVQRSIVWCARDLTVRRFRLQLLRSAKQHFRLWSTGRCGMPTVHLQLIPSLLGNLLPPFDHVSLVSCDEYHREFATIHNNYKKRTRFVHNLKNPLRVSATCWHCFVASRPSGDFFSSRGRAAKSSAHSLSKP